MNDAAPTAVAAPFVPGKFDGMPAALYHRVEAISASGAKKILRTPAHFRLMRDKPNEPTAAMRFGTACHEGILEPDTFESRVCLSPKFDMRRTGAKEAAALFAAQSVGKVALQQDDFDRARRCIDAVRSHPAARYLLAGAIVERSLFWRDKLFDVPCKARLDISNHGGVVDLKSCTDASPEGFSRSIGEFDYSLQGWSNFSGSEHVLDATPEFFAFICVETEAPFAVAVYTLGRESLMFGARQWDEALSRYRKAIESGTWQGYPDEITTINAPRWKLKF